MGVFRAETNRIASPRTLLKPRRFERLEQRRLLAVSVVEQEFVYLLNRARHDPAAYQQEQNLPVSLASVTPRGPLAINAQLTNSSQVKATDMASNNYFAHESPQGVHANQLVINAGYQLPSYFEARANYVESLAAGTQHDTAIEALNLLIIDAGVPGAGHRRHLLGMDDFYARNRDIGIGFASSPNSTYTNYWAAHLAMRDEPKELLTGVVFDDRDGDARYDAGEGLPGVTITVDGSRVTRTNASGGWSLVADSGAHTISASGGNFVGHSTANATVGEENVAVDFISGDVAGQVSFSKAYGTNVSDPIDVNANGSPSVIDALTVINHLGVSQDGGSPLYDFDVYLDVNGDGTVSAIDALQVINGLALLENQLSAELASAELAMVSISGAQSGDSTDKSSVTGAPVEAFSVERIPAFVVYNSDSGEPFRSPQSDSPSSQAGSHQKGEAELLDLALLSLMDGEVASNGI